MARNTRMAMMGAHDMLGIINFRKTKSRMHKGRITRSSIQMYRLIHDIFPFMAVRMCSSLMMV